MIFYRQAAFVLLLLMSAFGASYFIFKSDAPLKLMECHSKSLVDVQQREGVVREVFSKPLRQPVFSVSCDKSVLRWEESGLSEEMCGVEGALRGIRFSSGRLFWDKGLDKVVLSDDVTFTFKPFGDLFAKDEVVVTFDGPDLKLVECRGETNLDLLCGSTPLLVNGFGPVVFDPLQGTICWESASDGSQVHLIEKGLHIFADKLSVECDKVHFSPERCVMSGSVKLLNGGGLALADELTYCARTNELYLTGKESRRVLFSDEENRFEMSAEALRFKRSTPAQKGYIQGVGDVRFVLGDAEKENFLKFFSFLEGN